MKVKKIEAQHLRTIEYAIWQVSLKTKQLKFSGYITLHQNMTIQTQPS